MVVHAGLDWERVLALARSHGLMPLLHRHLSLQADGLSQPVAARLCAEARAAARRNLDLTGELLSLLQLMAGNDLPVIPLKGPGLAVHLYGDLALRPCGDLDLLVRPPDMPRAARLLVQRGYRAEPALSRGAAAVLLTSQHHQRFVRDPGPIVELHWRFTQREFPFSLDPERARARLTPVRLGGATVQILAPEDLLLYLSAHGAKHLWARLLWVGDVAALTQKGTMHWPDVTTRARSLGVARAVRLALVLARDLLGSDIAGEVAEWVSRDAAVSRLAALTRRRLFITDRLPAQGWERLGFYLKARERWRDKARSAFHLVATPTVAELTLVALPLGLRRLYYLLRPLRLAAKYAGRLWRAVRVRTVKDLLLRH
ncbi:MAG: hypothetical protein DMD69_17465 [Gemmatimonadetes bacterium]|nr:MAG: hypothetical protein DMD69_17465 [Gemmatimonadota bacterium]